MRDISYLRKAAVLSLAAVTVAATLTGCGLRSGEPEEVTTMLAPEGMALAALGYDPYDLAVADPLAVTETHEHRGPWGRRGRGPGAVLREGMLHGEMVVETADGPRTILMQRGEVTQTSDTGVTVASVDGFEQTWTYDDELRVVESRTLVEVSELAVGTEIGVAGHEDGSPVAHLIVITDR